MELRILKSKRKRLLDKRNTFEKLWWLRRLKKRIKNYIFIFSFLNFIAEIKCIFINIYDAYYCMNLSILKDKT